MKLWTRNFTLVTIATTLGSAGAIASSFALSFLVFDETGSTLASAIILAIQLIPYVILPLIISPLMDRLPRKAFLVFGDVCNGILYGALGLYLLHFEFSYIGYLFISLLLACLGAIDELAYTSIYPELIPEGCNQKGYAVSTMLYPILKVIMTPIAAVLLDTIGIPMLLLFQAGCSLLASITENQIDIDESHKTIQEHYSFKEWFQDIQEGYTYLRKEPGLMSIFGYMAVTNGVASGYSPILVAFFRTTPGMSVAMYSFFSVMEFIGRTVASFLQYHIQIPPKKKYSITFFAYVLYESLDMCLLWISYPLMLVNRTLCGFIGTTSAIVRSGTIQQYIPENLRSRINAFSSILLTAVSSVLSLLIGFLGEIIDYRYCVSIAAGISLLACIVLIGGHKKSIKQMYESVQN